MTAGASFLVLDCMLFCQGPLVAWVAMGVMQQLTLLHSSSSGRGDDGTSSAFNANQRRCRVPGMCLTPRQLLCRHVLFKSWIVRFVTSRASIA